MASVTSIDRGRGMEGTSVSLKRRWQVGARIGDRSGFGVVFRATDEAGMLCAIKFVPKAPGAGRELLFAGLDGVRNIVPVVDSGETPDHWVLVMPMATKSLQQQLAAGRLDLAGAVAVMIDVATALSDLSDRVVHRDIKPANVLLLNSVWCLADFGISRYADATTGTDTRKFAWTPPYAAPEQWRMERATAATDVYAFGVMAFEMLEGAWPFTGPRADDFREQHLTYATPPMKAVPNRLAAIVEECLVKTPGARPGAGNLLSRLQKLEARPAPPGIALLEEANRAEVARRSELERERTQSTSAEGRRRELWDVGLTLLDRIGTELVAALVVAAPSATSQTVADGWHLTLNTAVLSFREEPPADRPEWGEFHTPPLEVMAHASLGLRMPANENGYMGRSHSLWYCDAVREGEFQWYETAFMASPLVRGSGSEAPFALPPREDAAKALWRGMDEYQLAWPFTPLNSGDLDEFIERWANWLGLASQGRLTHPSQMPERNPQGSWRDN